MSVARTHLEVGRTRGGRLISRCGIERKPHGKPYVHTLRGSTMDQQRLLSRLAVNCGDCLRLMAEDLVFGVTPRRVDRVIAELWLVQAQLDGEVAEQMRAALKVLEGVGYAVG